MAYGLPEFTMDAAITALQLGTETADMVRINMDRRRKILEEKLGAVQGLDFYSSVGGMYVVLDVRKLPVTSYQFSRDLLDNYDVTVLACDGFGETGKGLIRISLCAEDDNMEIACEKISAYVSTLTKNDP